MGTIVGGLVRFIFFKIDEIVFSFITMVYGLLLDISRITVLHDAIDPFFNRIYSLLCIFMLFKVSFSILTYIINPDDFVDKNKGLSKVITNVILTLVMLVFIPYGFDAAYKLQNIIIKEETIGKIILGSSHETTFDRSGEMLSFETLKAFYHVSDSLTGCEGIGTDKFNQTACSSELDSNGVSATEIHNYIVDYDIKNYLNLDIVQAKDANGNFVMDYIFIISTAAGVVIVLLLINFCFDIAVRGIKLGFLELMAPVPIISRLDPKKGKEVFDKWVKACISTFLDLFIRLLAIYFAIFVIQFLCNSTVFTDNITGESARGLAKVFVILGALLFARQLPKMISDIFGFDAKGKFGLNPMKKLRETGVPGVAAVGAAGLAGFGANMMEAKNAQGDPRNLLGRVASGFGGMGSAMVNTGKNVLKNKGEKNFQSLKTGVATSSNNRRLRESGYGIPAKIQDTWTDMSGHDFDTGTTSQLKNEINANKEIARNARDEETQARNELRDFRTRIGAQKSQEVQRLLMSREMDKDENGKVLRDKTTGVIQFKTDLPSNYAAYQASATASGVAAGSILSQAEFDDLKAYTDMINTADGTAFKAEKDVKKAEEKAGLAKPSK